MNASKTLSLPELIVRLLARGEPMTAAQLVSATGKSQPSISLALSMLGEQICRIGAARSSQYALKQDFMGLRAMQRMHWEGAPFDDGASPMGEITFLHGDRLHVKWLGRDWLPKTHQLPWFLTPLRLQGFMGKQYARSRADLPPDPQRWDLAQTLYVATLHARNAPGAFTVGAPIGEMVDEVSSDLPKRLAHYEALANSSSQYLPKGACVGGKQPKFIAQYADAGAWQQVIVKFTPPHETPCGKRWRVLLLLEDLASKLLSRHGIAVARTQVLSSNERSFLESTRFDRMGAEGKRHVVAIDALHEEFVTGPRQNWLVTAQTLHQKRMISDQELRSIARIQAFGHFIGNTDMHFGNLSFFVDDVLNPQISLAPVYDMLPMMWKPDPFFELSHSPVRPPHPTHGFPREQEKAKLWAIEFWEQAASLDIGAELQAAAVESARRLKTNFADV